MFSMRQRLKHCSVILLMTICVQAIGLGQENRRPLNKTPPIRLTRTEAGYQATLLFHKQRGMLNLEVVSQDKKASAALPMTRRAELWKPLLEQAFREHGRRPQHLLTVAEYPELTARIAVAAVSSGKWNLKTGKPRSGEAGAAVKELLLRGRLFSELENLFDSFGYRVSIDSVEAVMLCRWKEIQSQHIEVPAQPKLRAESLVPCGASILFRLTAKERGE